MSRAIGIDLGTTYTVVACIQDGRPLVVPNREGQRLTPSVVAVPEDGPIVVGQAARDGAGVNPLETIFSIKRHMGSGHRVKVRNRVLSPDEISSHILRKVKVDAESFLGEPVDRAVITVPAYFNDRQRQATREAALQAGLEVLRIINEPTAAALAYGIDKDEAHHILVWDLGGGTFDVSILELGDGVFEVRAVSGDSHLGGDDMDHLVAEDLVEEYRKVRGMEFPRDAGLRHRLREAAELAKIQLSVSPVTRILLPPVGHPGAESLEVELSRDRLERLIGGLLRRMEVCTGQALADAGLSPAEIDRVILVGGASRMPAVRDLARGILGKEPYRHLNPDEVVALGAAIQAGMLLGQVEKVVLLDVLPLSLGVESQGGLMARIISRNTPLPAQGTRLFTTAVDGQTSMDIHVLQGERSLAGDDISLGRFNLADIPPAPRGVPKVEVAFRVDVNGILHVSATDLLTEREVKVKMASTLLHPLEVHQLLDVAGRKAQADGVKKQEIEARMEAERVMAAAEVALDVARYLADPRAEQLGALATQLEEALEAENAADIQALCGRVRILLKLSSGSGRGRLGWDGRPGSRRPSGSLTPGSP